MRTDAYWAGRMEALNEALLGKGESYVRTLNEEYARAMASIQKDVDAFYHRFAVNNSIDLASARQMLKVGELREFKWTVEDYIKAGQENAVDQRWMKELENASIRVRVSRLEALQLQMRQQVETLAAKRQAGTAESMGGIYKDGYYQSIFELQKGAGVGHSFAKLDNQQAEKLLVTPWAPDGKNFSARIWQDRTKLVTELQTTLVQGLIRGDSSEEMISRLQERMGVSRSAAARLVMTEAAYFSGQARLDGYRELGVGSYKYTATLDKRTSAICRDMDGEVIPVVDAQAGVNYPPLHAHCRSTTIPHYEDNVQERAARGNDGKTYQVPGDMTYKEWAVEHVPIIKPDNPEETEPVMPIEPPKVKTEASHSQFDSVIMKSSYRKFENEENVKAWTDIVSPAWVEKLTEEEVEAVKMYTGYDSEAINGNLRRGGGNTQLDAIADQISSALQKFELPEGITVYRGLQRNIFEKPASELVGAIVDELGFVSTALLADSAFEGTVRLELRVPPNSKGAAVVALSDFEDEYEFLLDRQTRYRITEASEIAGVMLIIAEVVKDV